MKIYKIFFNLQIFEIFFSNYWTSLVNGFKSFLYYILKMQKFILLFVAKTICFGSLIFIAVSVTNPWCDFLITAILFLWNESNPMLAYLLGGYILDSYSNYDPNSLSISLSVPSLIDYIVIFLIFIARKFLLFICRNFDYSILLLQYFISRTQDIIFSYNIYFISFADYFIARCQQIILSYMIITHSQDCILLYKLYFILRSQQIIVRWNMIISRSQEIILPYMIYFISLIQYFIECIQGIILSYKKYSCFSKLQAAIHHKFSRPRLVSPVIYQYIPHRQNSGINSKFSRFYSDTSFITSEKMDMIKMSGEKNNWWMAKSNTFYPAISPHDVSFELKNFLNLFKRNFNVEFFSISLVIKFKNDHIRDCSRQQLSSIHEIDKLIAAINTIFNYKHIMMHISEGESVYTFNRDKKLPIGNIWFRFKPYKKLKDTKYESFISSSDIADSLNREKSFNAVKSVLIKDVKIPNTMEISMWENVEFINDKNAFCYYNIKSEDGNTEKKIIFKIQINKIGKKITNNILVTINNVEQFTIIDSRNEKDKSSTFTREVVEKNNATGKSESKFFVVKNGKNIFHYRDIKAGKITPLKKRVINVDKRKLITLDIETIMMEIKEGGKGGKNEKFTHKMIPICISYYDGKEVKSFVEKNIKKWRENIINAIKSLMHRRYDGYRVYCHNFSHFDSIFLIDILAELGEISPIMRHGKFLKIIFKYKNISGRKYSLYFHDSLLILPNTLALLSKTFNVENKKGIFPFTFLNECFVNKNLKYSGEIPAYKYYKETMNSRKRDEVFTYKDYLNLRKDFKDKKWILLNELESYCGNDCIALYQIIAKFQTEIYSKFFVDVLNYATISSLAFAIFRTAFLEENVWIPNIQSKIHFWIKQSYYGGITDVYKPSGKNLKSYDINSLYPFAMRNFPMPCGKITYFQGDLNEYGKSIINKNKLGVFKVDVKSPENLHKPILPTRIKTDGGVRTVFPLGEWTGCYFSEEIKNAMKYGYEFNIREGYLFDSANIFTKYVDELYSIKSTVEKSNAWYYLSKLLLNSLYGRFGLNPIFQKVIILDNNNDEEEQEIIKNKKHVNILPLPSGKVMIMFIDTDDVRINNISIPISAAISSYSRIVMSHYLINYSDNIYYIDTDGIKMDKELPDDEIDSKLLGKMKFEYELSEFTALAPKVYGGVYLKPHNKGEDEFVKVKGYSSHIPYNKFKKGLQKGYKIKLNHNKWYRHLDKSVILIADDEYSLEITEGKRELIFDKKGMFIDTAPIRIKSIENVNLELSDENNE